MVEDVYKGSQPYLVNLAMKWEENIRFFMGDQYIYFNETRRRFEPIPVTKFNQFLPRPVTNLILPIIQTLTSIFTRQKPSATVRANSNDESDVNAAKLADRIQDAKWEIDEETLKHITAVLIALICGTVIRKDFWDSSKGPVSGMLGENVGDSDVEMIDPFRFIPDLNGESYFIEANLQPISWIKQQYGKMEFGYTGLAEKVKEDTGLSAVMQLHQRLKTASGTGSNWGSSESSTDLKGFSVLKEAYIKPTKNHPSGIMIVVADGKTLYARECPYFDPRYSDSWHPYTFFHYQKIPFRWHGLSIVDNLLKLQQRLNSIDALIILNRMTMAIPQWLKPIGCGVQEGYLSGAPGLEIPYNPVGANGVKPEKLLGTGLPGDIIKERQDVIEAMHRISGDNEVLSGLRPEGVNTAAAMNMVLEQSFSKFNPITQSFEKFIEKGQTKKLRLIASKYKEQRPEFIAQLKSMNKDNLDVEIKDFIGADLQDNVNVRIEAGSSLPRSKIVEQQTYQELAKNGAFGPIDPIQNPMGNQEFLEKFGLQPITTELNADVKKAKWVNSVLTSVNRGEMPPEKIPPIEDFDNIQIHLKVLTDRMKSPSFEDPMGVFRARYGDLMGRFQAAQAMSVPTFPQGEGQPVQPESLPSEGVPPGVQIQ